MPNAPPRQVLAKLAPEIKLALVDYALREGLSMSDAAVSLIAARVGFAFTASGRRLRERPSPTPSVVLSMRPSDVPKVDGAAYQAGVDRNVFINMVLAEALDVDFNPTGAV